jgi:hypothetical protein
LSRCACFDGYTTSAKKQQNAEHFARTCEITNRVIEQVHYNLFLFLLSMRFLKIKNSKVEGIIKPMYTYIYNNHELILLFIFKNSFRSTFDSTSKPVVIIKVKRIENSIFLYSIKNIFLFFEIGKNSNKNAGNEKYI